MVFGGVSTERLQLNEDTLGTGGPYQPVNPEAQDALPEVRRLVLPGATQRRRRWRMRSSWRGRCRRWRTSPLATC